MNVTMSCSNTEVAGEIWLAFDQPILPFLNITQTDIQVTIKESSAITLSNYSLDAMSDSEIKMTFSYSQSILAGTIANVSFESAYLPTLLGILSNHSYDLLNNSCSVSLLEYYPFSPAETTAISSANSITNYGSPAISAVINVNNFLGSEGGSFIIGSALVAQMIQLNRFVNTAFPPNLLILFNNSVQEVVSNTFPIHFGTGSTRNTRSQNISDLIKDNSKFEVYGMNPNVFEGGQSQLLTIGILLLLLLIVILTKKIKSSEKIKKIRQKIYNFLRWNYIILTVVTSTLRFYMFAILNLKYPDFTNTFGIFSFIFAIVFVLMLLILMIFLIESIKKYHASLKKKIRDPILRRRQLIEQVIFRRRFSILVQDYKNDNVWQLQFVPITITRALVTNIFLICFAQTELAQAFLLALYTIIYWSYLVKYRPIKNKFNMVSLLAAESVLVIVSICIIIICFLNFGGGNPSNTKLKIGWVIISADYLIVGIIMLKTLWIIVQAAKNLVSKSKKHPEANQRIKRSRFSNNDSRNPLARINLATRPQNDFDSPIASHKEKNKQNNHQMPSQDRISFHQKPKYQVTKNDSRRLAKIRADHINFISSS